MVSESDDIRDEVDVTRGEYSDLVERMRKIEEAFDLLLRAVEHNVKNGVLLLPVD